MPAGGVEFCGDGGDVDEFPHLDRGAQGQPAGIEGQAHGRPEAAEVGIEVVSLIAHHHEFAGLVGGDQERGVELPQEGREVHRVNGTQRLGLGSLGLGSLGLGSLGLGVGAWSVVVRSRGGRFGGGWHGDVSLGSIASRRGGKPGHTDCRATRRLSRWTPW